MDRSQMIKIKKGLSNKYAYRRCSPNKMNTMKLLCKTILFAADGLNKIFRKTTISRLCRFRTNEIIVDTRN